MVVLLTESLASGSIRWAFWAGPALDPPVRYRFDVREPAPRASVNDTARRVKQSRLLHAYEKERREKQEAKAVTDARRAKLAYECGRLAEELEQTRTARYLYRPRDDGERNVLSNEERSAHLRKIEKARAARRCR